ncbi:MAG TPA: metalloregulator ArsR/SmtB family transcription factor [Thermoanaerobaculia bacterium]|nr:metalloregulator ArsR/SmtB family transcription factor [Thermoanaerobaculia bacterium]
MSPRQSNAALKRSAPVFAALGDATRLHVVSRLCSEGPLSITELTEGSDVTRQAVTKHLGVLAAAGLVRDFRDGREHVWELKTRQLEEARRTLDAISNQWDEALERLRAMVEE